jgi:hypothetical protein
MTLAAMLAVRIGALTVLLEQHFPGQVIHL